jgi:mycofactocin precursor
MCSGTIGLRRSCRIGGVVYATAMAENTVAIDPLARSAQAVDAGDGEPLVEEELLVEEVSIDGMCGVY